MGVTMRVHDRIHEARTADAELHPAGITLPGYDHEVSWACPCTFMAAAASFRGTRASHGRMTMMPYAAGVRSHDGGMARMARRLRDRAWKPRRTNDVDSPPSDGHSTAPAVASGGNVDRPEQTAEERC
jgi:hypothetical protein